MHARVRRTALGLAGLLAAAPLAGAGVAEAATVKIPNPCTIVPVATVTKDLGYAKSVTPQRKLTTQYHARVCTFTYPHLKLTIQLSPPEGSGGGGAKISHPSGMGPNARLYQPLPGSKAQFASLSFSHHGRDGFLYINKDQPVKGLEAVGRAVYSKL